MMEYPHLMSRHRKKNPPPTITICTVPKLNHPLLAFSPAGPLGKEAFQRSNEFLLASSQPSQPQIWK